MTFTKLSLMWQNLPKIADGAMDSRRVGDKRPMRHPNNTGLTWHLFTGGPFRVLPRHGEPFSVYEWVTQKTIKTIAFLPIYTAIIVTLVLMIQVFGVPFA